MPKTFENQGRLPKLPVPKFVETLSKLYWTLLPFVQSEQLAGALKAEIAGFQRTLGPQLQQRFLQHAGNKDNWLDAWWFCLAYHTWRDALPVNSNWLILPAFQERLLIQSPRIARWQIASSKAGFDSKVLKVVHDMRFVVSQSNIDGGDYGSGLTGDQPTQAYNTQYYLVGPGEGSYISLQHDASALFQNAAVLTRVIGAAKNMSYKPVTVDECLGQAACRTEASRVPRLTPRLH